LEYANPSNIAEWKNRFGVNDFFQVLEKIQERRTSANGVFSIKVHYPHIKLFGEFKQLVDFFPNAYFILLSRENVLRQAVSLSIARQTGVWISGQKPIDDNPTYDFKDIDKCLRETIINNSSWRYKLAASGCNYIEMTFEKICEDLSLSIKNIADFMDIDIDLNNLPDEHATQKIYF
jgi:LPS sulfotransferase NodH